MVADSSLPDDYVARVRDGLLTWFRANARDLPWRRTRNPYCILVSEVMLQQTQVDRVIPYYERFLAAFPSVDTLASAPTAAVIRLWSGLGYNRRAVNLQRAVRAVVDQFTGQFPTSPKELESLPGIGAYTAGAIAAFAFEQDVAFLDTNMRRVVKRVVFGVGADDAAVGEAALLGAARQLVPSGAGWEWNQALIEFGALQCTARNPACVICPVQRDCAAYPEMQTAIAESRLRPRRTAAPFETTSRYYRGRIVETLRALPSSDTRGLAFDELGPRVRPQFGPADLPWLEGLVLDLQRDGLAMVAEDEPPYEANAGGAIPKRVRLPD